MPMGTSDEIADLTKQLNELLELREALKPLAAIADEYDRDCLDECRPEWVASGSERFDLDAELYKGRGGKQLLTLRHAMQARLALTGKPFSGSTYTERTRRAKELFESVYIGGITWDSMSDERREEFCKKTDALYEAGKLK